MASVHEVVVLVATESEHSVFEGFDAVDAPLVVSRGLGELSFDRGCRVEAVGIFFGEGEVDGHVFGGQDDDVSGEAVAEGVEAGFAFAFGGVGASAAGGFEFWCCHVCSPGFVLPCGCWGWLGFLVFLLILLRI